MTSDRGWTQLATDCYLSGQDCINCPVPTWGLESLTDGCQMPKAVKALQEGNKPLISTYVNRYYKSYTKGLGHRDAG